MTQVLIIRPEPGASATLAAARALGLDAVAQPLFEVRACAWDAPDPAAIDGLLLGSANAIRFAGPALTLYSGMPAHAVGALTLEAARAHWLVPGIAGEGGLQAVIDALPQTPTRLLRLAGAEHVALELPPHVTLETRVAYAAKHLPMPAECAELLVMGALVLLHSAAAAHHFAGECDRLKVPRAAISIAALGPRIAAAAGHGWATCHAADMPNDPALLALAVKMCH